MLPCIQVKEETSGLELDGRRVRVDYSITQRAHTPTPGVYMGKPSQYVIYDHFIFLHNFINSWIGHLVKSVRWPSRHCNMAVDVQVILKGKFENSLEQ